MTRCVITKYESDYKIYMFKIIKEGKETIKKEENKMKKGRDLKPNRNSKNIKQLSILKTQLDGSNIKLDTTEESYSFGS